MAVESEPKEATVVSSKSLTGGQNLPEEVLVLHQTWKDGESLRKDIFVANDPPNNHSSMWEHQSLWNTCQRWKKPAIANLALIYTSPGFNVYEVGFTIISSYESAESFDHTCSFSCHPSSECRTILSPSLWDSHRSDEDEAKWHLRALSASSASWTCRQKTVPRFQGTPSWWHRSPDLGSVSVLTHSSCPWWLGIFTCLHSPCHLSLEHSPVFPDTQVLPCSDAFAPPAVCSRRWMTQRSLLSQPLHLISLTATLAQCDSKQLQPVRCFLAADAGGHCAQLLRILPVSLSTMCPHSIKPFSRTFLCTAHAFVAISVGSVASWNGYESLALLQPLLINLRC